MAKHEKQGSSQRKCREHLSNLPSHRDNATHQRISISQPCYEEKGMECLYPTKSQRSIIGTSWYSYTISGTPMWLMIFQWSEKINLSRSGSGCWTSWVNQITLWPALSKWVGWMKPISMWSARQELLFPKRFVCKLWQSINQSLVFRYTCPITARDLVWDTRLWMPRL